MKFIYPADYFNVKKIDDAFASEAESLRSIGFEVDILTNKKLNKGEYIYRGWMLDDVEYDNLNSLIENNESSLLTNKDNYFSSHYLPNWYNLLKEYTPETIIINIKDINEIENILFNNDWNGYFVKDYVKSLTTTNGSIAKNKEEVYSIIKELQIKKGLIGGICLRKVIDFVVDSEIRYFSLNGTIMTPTGSVPDIVNKINSKIDSKFFSIDIIKDKSGKDWLVEIGDGQVSDLKYPWTEKLFASEISSALSSV